MQVRKIIFWVLAVVITLVAAVFQRKTGPTYPKEVSFEYEGQLYEFELIRSAETGENCVFTIPVTDNQLDVFLTYKRYPTQDEWTRLQLEYEQGEVLVELPHQPAAGKLIYYLEFMDGGKVIKSWKDEPVVVRFKGAVPGVVLLIHVIAMFLAMLLSNVAGLFAIAKIPAYKRYTYLTFLFLTIGGMIFGPMVQKHAFGEYWTGIPNGWDLTDNKTLIAFVGFLVAWLGNVKKQRPYLTLIASLLVLIIFSIPHSMFGSQFDYNSGEVTQGFIVLIIAVQTLKTGGKTEQVRKLN